MYHRGAMRAFKWNEILFAVAKMYMLLKGMKNVQQVSCVHDKAVKRLVWNKLNIMPWNIGLVAHVRCMWLPCAIYKFNYNHSFSISLYLIYTDRPFFWFAKEVITYVNVFIKDTIFLINYNASYLNFYISSKPWFYTFCFTIS